MNTLEETAVVKDLIQTLIKAKKTIRTYPENNPVYLNIINTTFSKFSAFFISGRELVLKIKQNEILFGTERVYFNPDKDDNLAMFFFRDGIRELQFRDGLTQQELEEFLKIITLDFEREAVDDDIVTLLWEKDFQDIKYVADEDFLIEDEEYGIKAEDEIKGKSPAGHEFKRAYEDAFNAEDVGEVAILSLTEEDIERLASEINYDNSENKLEKLSTLLFDILLAAESPSDHEGLVNFIKETMQYAAKCGDIKTFISILRKLKQYSEDDGINEACRKHFSSLIRLACSEDFIRIISGMFDSEIETDDSLLNEYTEFLEGNAVTPLISALGELKTIKGRRKVINILVDLGKKDIQTIVKGLRDSRWFVVRNIIYILRQIGDKKAVEYLLNSAKHPDLRVRKEAIKALGELKSIHAIQTLRYGLDDQDASVRRASVEALCAIGSDTAKRIMLAKISEKNFGVRDFDEKKAFYEGLSAWDDAEISEFMIKTLSRTALFKKSQTDEDKACAAHCLGLMGRKEAIPAIKKLKDSGSRLLNDYAINALKRLGYDRHS